VPAGTVILEENTATVFGMGWIHVTRVTIHLLVVSNVTLKVTAENLATLQVSYHFLQKLLLQGLFRY